MNELCITPISTHGLDIGEGPHWVEKEQALVYVDLTQGDVYKYYVNSKREQKLHVENVGTGPEAGFIIPVEGLQDDYVIGVGKTLSAVHWTANDGDDIVKKVDPLITIDKNSATRFNDAKCDPRGRLWAGTMGSQLESGVHPPFLGSLYRFDSTLEPKTMVKEVSISNGLTWSNQLDTLYYIDSPQHTVDAFDYDYRSGDISNRRVVFDLKKHGISGIPDGMTIDQDGHLWVACFLGWQVICIDPMTRSLIRSVTVESSQITSCCFGGSDYSTLFVTSGTRDRPSSELKCNPDSGKTFAIHGLGVKGSPASSFKVNHKTLEAIRGSSKC